MLECSVPVSIAILGICLIQIDPGMAELKLFEEKTLTEIFVNEGMRSFMP